MMKINKNVERRDVPAKKYNNFEKKQEIKQFFNFICETRV